MVWRYILFLGLVFLIGCESALDEGSKSKFSDVVVKAMYDNVYCFEEPVSQCVDVSYPYVRVLNAEDFTETGMISLVVNVGKRIDAELPGVSKGEIMFSFRDSNQKVIKRLYWEEGKWSE